MTTLPLTLPRRKPRPLLPARYRLLALSALVAVVSAAVLILFATPDQRAVFSPALAAVNLTLFFVAVLYKRDGELPVFEAGTLWVLATTMYTAYPMLNFGFGGMRWTFPADYRLIHYDPSPQEMGAFTWNHVLYLATFVVVYLLVRGRKRVPRAFATMPRSLQRAVIVSLIVTVGILFLSRIVLLPPGAISDNPYEGGTFAYRADMPLIFLQVLNIASSMVFVLRLLFGVVVLSNWRDKRWRLVLVIWMLLEFLVVARSLSRSTFVLLLVSLGMFYHRLVRPLTLRVAVAGGLLIVIGFLGFGLMRDMRYDFLDTREMFLTNNEFQGLYANAYDVYMQKKMQVLPEPPPQMFWFDLYLLVPSQFLPFEKWDPSEWYAEVLGIRWTGNRVMFGVMAQAMLGRGAIEVFVRAVAIAVVLALLHRWYVRRAERFWPTAMYVYISIYTYYTFRSTSFYPLYLIVYYFGAAFVVVSMVQIAGTRVRRIARKIR